MTIMLHELQCGHQCSPIAKTDAKKAKVRVSQKVWVGMAFEGSPSLSHNINNHWGRSTF
jgi:hypothetical protein